MSINDQAKLTCPFCGFAQVATMPEEACQYFYECIQCRKVIKPKRGDCCVFCSYADKPCPPRQREKIA